MKKFIVASFIFIVSNAFSSVVWVLVSNGNNGDKIFVESKSMQKNGELITYWNRVNLSKKTSGGASSFKAQETINCKQKEKITRFVQSFSDLDNSGEVLASFNPNDRWRPIPPDSIDWTLYEFICK